MNLSNFPKSRIPAAQVARGPTIDRYRERMESFRVEFEADRAAIVETCTRMAWLADQRRWDELAEQFTDEVAVDYTSLDGGTPRRVSGRDLVAGWRAGLSGFQATQHLVTNHLVTIESGHAVVTAAFQATHLLPNDRGGPIWRIGGITATNWSAPNAG